MTWLWFTIWGVGYLVALVPLARWMRDEYTSKTEAGVMSIMGSLIWPAFLALWIVYHAGRALGRLT